MDADAIVIGAGAAGLAAARSLAARSLRVIVVEARARTGGRVYSDTSERAPVPAELGAEFIHGKAAETMAILREAGTTAVETAGESWTYENGALQREDDAFRTSAAIFTQADSLERDESVERFLQRFQANAAMRDSVAAARTFVEGFDAADPAVASVYGIAAEWQSGVDFSSARPLGGYPPMFTYLHDACVTAGVDIQLSTAVRRLAWRPGEVAVDVDTATGSSHTIWARVAVVTLPVGVLRHQGDEREIVFAPGLPAAKRDALAYIEMGPVVKMNLRFRTPFWERICDERYRDAAFFRRAGQPYAAYWTQFPLRSNLIVAWAAGPKASALAQTPHPELIGLALDGFGDLFRERTLAQHEFLGAAMHDWSRDPYARGAYSYLTVGGAGARVALAAPVENTLFFAGEATSNDGQGGTVNGALETGERAAREAAASLGATALDA
jgi:monoamine oxidase